MNIIQYSLLTLVAIIHLYILVLEMLLWTKPKGIKTFGLKSKDFAEETKVLAANQGVYNGFLAAGLTWSILSQKIDVGIFFFICVFIAGLYGSFSTKKPRIFVIQSIPALLGLISLIL
ncbi:membrane protein [Tenacibaculum sp. KUL118]|nr:membrane protein [Tenacibaculum sp. KUL118]